MEVPASFLSMLGLVFGISFTAIVALRVIQSLLYRLDPQLQTLCALEGCEPRFPVGQPAVMAVACWLLFAFG